MSFYESVFIIRQDVSSADVDKITEDVSAVLTNLGSEILKKEYWGLRSLAYDISNNKKGHYILVGHSSSNQALKALEHKMKYSQDVIRHLTLKVEEISQEPSPILRAETDGFENSIDVTIV